MEFRDYYQVLGVERSASADEIKRAYRKLARKYHPDVSKAPDAEQRMQAVNEAYAALSDPEKRAAYDQVGRGFHAGQEFRPPPDWDAGFEFSFGRGPGGQAGDFSDFFSTLFGGMGGAGRQRGFRTHGEDHHAKIMIDLEDALRGATRAISLRVPTVDGRGHVAVRERTLNVKIPRGVADGQQIRLAGQGSPGLGGGPPGDLYLEVRFNPHPRFRVDGRDLLQSVPVAPWELALGGAIEVATPGGTVQVRIPPGSQTGRKLRLKGRGIPGATPGDLYLELQVVLPPADSNKARELYESMAREFDFHPRRAAGGRG